VSIYQAEGTDSKTITLSLQFTSHEKTLTSADITPLMETVARAAGEKLGAEVV
jgi:phenylalanyl-tRNA synthetase beta subunit